MSAEAGPATPPPSRGRPNAWQRFRALPLGMRGSVYVATGLVLLLVVLALTSVVLVRRPLPQTTGTLEVAGLDGPVEVLRDSSGIPQLYADSTEDLMLAQGFVAAQDRFFEMDVRRHLTAGRLAELLGEEALASDVAIRTMGWRRVAEAELPLLAPETRTALDAYARGVNAYLEERTTGQLALEYVVLGIGEVDYSPEPWTAVDSLAWLKAVAWDLRGNVQDEVDRVLARAAVGRSRAAELYPAYPYGESEPIVGQGAVVDGVFEQDATDGGTRKPMRAPTGPGLDVVRGLSGLEWLDSWQSSDGVGSNAWVVSGEHTDTGAPLLANDPHLEVSSPGPLLQVGLHCRDVGPSCPFDVAGYSYAGVPGVVIGHNADIAWGFTRMGADVSDLFVERVTESTWRHGGRSLPLKRRVETIRVEGGDDVTLTVRSTDHGPIVSDVDDVLNEVAGLAPVRRRAGEEYAVSLSWTGLTPTPTADALLQLNLARDWSSFREALASFAAPTVDVVYADREGHIGYQGAGLVPIRKSGNDGRLPSAGWRQENDWTGEHVPYDGLPNVLDPEGGVLVAANQAVAGEDYPYFLTDDWDHGYRAQRINGLLDAALAPTFEDADQTLSLGELAAMQLDDRTPLGPVLTPYLLAAELPEGYYSEGQELLASWDFEQAADSAAAAYFNVVWSNLLALTFHDELPETIRPDGGQRWVAVVTALLEDPGNAFWDDVDTEQRETRDDVVVAALRAARDELTRRVAIKAEEWRWGALHELDLRSASMSGRTLGGLFDRGGREASGGGASVNATSWDAARGYDVTVAPAMRMVVSLADGEDLAGLDRSRWVSLTGASGHAFDDHFLDQADRWVEGRTLPWLFTEDAVRAAADDSLVLTPREGAGAG